MLFVYNMRYMPRLLIGYILMINKLSGVSYVAHLKTAGHSYIWSANSKLRNYSSSTHPPTHAHHLSRAHIALAAAICPASLSSRPFQVSRYTNHETVLFTSFVVHVDSRCNRMRALLTANHFLHSLYTQLCVHGTPPETFRFSTLGLVNTSLNILIQ